MDAKPFDEKCGVAVSRDLLAAIGTDVFARREVLGNPTEALVADLAGAPRIDE